MEDLERYGDYNDTEDADGVEVDGDGRKKVPVLKILIALVFAAVLGLLGYRLYLFDYYPPAIREVLPTEVLTAYLRDAEGDIGATTQKLRFPYDDSQDGNFFCDHLLVVPAAGELQIAVRYNVSALTVIAEKYGAASLDPDAPDYLSFRLTDNYGRDYGGPTDVRFASKSMYRYFRLAFDGIDFSAPPDGLGAPEWIRLEIFFAGEDEPFSYVLIYENNEVYSAFSPATVKVKGEER